MKRVVYCILNSIEWLLTGKEDGVPGLVMIVGFGALFIFMLVTSPAWGPIWLLSKWCGYTWDGIK